jgi:ATP-binding cassette, subfamily C (CFTR/MRP), member 1
MAVGRRRGVQRRRCFLSVGFLFHRLRFDDEIDGIVSVNSMPVLKGLSLSVASQQHIAVCGRSGSGKTSLFLCLLQMMDIVDGQITIDGVNISTLNSEQVRSSINVIPQDPFLMPGTVRFNMDPFDIASDDIIIKALGRVGLWATIQERGGLGENIDTAAWSAGQKQLFCLARATVKKCKIVVLDEAASRYAVSSLLRVKAT